MLKQTETEQSAGPEEADAPCAKAAPVPSEAARAALAARLKARFAEQLAALRAEAEKERLMATLADCMAYELGLCIGRYGHGAAAHILGRIGSHTQGCIDLDEAAAEAKAARKEGYLPH